MKIDKRTILFKQVARVYKDWHQIKDVEGMHIKKKGKEPKNTKRYKKNLIYKFNFLFNEHRSKKR